MKEYTPHLIIGVLCLVIGYFLYPQFNKPPVKPLKTEYIKGKSVPIKAQTTINRVAKVEEIKAVTSNDTARTQIVVDTDSVKSTTDVAFAFIDSTFKVSQTIDCIERSYDRVDTVKTFVEVPKELPCPEPRFYQRPMFNFVAGILVTLIIEIVAVVVDIMRIDIEDTDYMMILFALRNFVDRCIPQDKNAYKRILKDLGEQLADQLTNSEVDQLITLMNYKFLLVDNSQKHL
ncbi:MAG: hypothetical protein IPJ03_22415 [Ignavibacteriales bacterium]|nr:hypothetical protein [Ignavibacteriales bacterium]